MEAFANQVIVGLVRGGLYALMAVGLTLVLGVMDIPNFAHGELYMLGAYGAFFAYSAGLHPLLAILAAGVFAFVIGLLIDRGVFYFLRRKFTDQWVQKTFLITVALSLALVNIVQVAWQARRRGIVRYWEGSVRLGPGIVIPADRFAGLVIALFLIILLWLFLSRTRTGRAIRAVSQDETGAVMMGVNLDRINAVTFGLSSMLAGMAGGTLLSIIPAYPTCGAGPLQSSWFVVILAGLGSVLGSILGGFIVGIIEALSYNYLGQGWQEVVSLGILVLILVVKPSGLFSRGGES